MSRAKHSTLRIIGTTLFIAGAAFRPLSAQESQVTAPSQVMEPPAQPAAAPVIEVPSLSLGEAVRLTLLHNPQVLLAQQEVALAAGAYQQERGFFDHAFEAAPAYNYSKTEILPFLRQRERDKRVRLKALADGYGRMAEELEKALAESQNPPPCPEGVDFADVIIVTGLGDTIELEEICIPRDLTTTRRVLEAIGAGDFNLGETISDLVQLQREQLSLRKEIAHTIGTKAALALERQAEMPEDEVVKNLTFDFAYVTPFRNGMTFRGDLRLQSEEDNFRAKPLDPTFGGLGTPNHFPSFIKASLDIPLGKGRGRVATAAPERAAEENLAAQRQLLRHTMAEEVFGTVLAFTNLMTSQETLKLLEDSAAANRRIVEATQQLVEANELARTELTRAQARAAVVQEAVADAKLSLVEARFALAQAMGLKVQSVDNAPITRDTFPDELVSAQNSDTLAERAIVERRDLRAVDRLRDAAKILSEGAKADLKRQIDLNVSGGISTFYDSPFFRYLPDELNEPPPKPPVHFYSPRGYWRAWRGDWKPFFKIELVVDWPFKNNVARGQFIQKESSLNRAQIELADLERTILDNIIRVTGALDRAKNVIERRRGALGYFEQTLDASLEMFEAGDITLIDTLITEEDLTRERIQLARAMRVYLSLLARLRFEIGDLLRFADEGTISESVEFSLQGLVAGPPDE
jgi:outer membrane protein TolC